MAIKKKQLEADNLKRQANALQKNSVKKNQTAEQRAIAHSNQSLNRTSSTSGHKPKSKLKTKTKAEESTSNSKFKQRKIISSVSSVLKDSTTETLKSGVENYKNELEKNDVGVQVAGQSLTAANKVLKLNKRAMANFQNSKTSKIVRADNLATNQTKSINHFKLVKKNRELGQAQKELKFKAAQIKTQKASLQKKNTEARSNFFKKTTVIPLSSSLKKGAASYKSQLERDETGVEVVSKGSTLVKQSVISIDKARKKLKGSKKIGTTTKTKLNGQSSKLKKKVTIVKKATPNNKLQKKAIKKSIANRNRKGRFLGKASGIVGNANAALVNFIKNFSFVAIKKAILGKVAAIAGGGLTVLVPVFVVMGLIILIVALFGAGGSHQQQVEGTIGVAQNLSPEVERWRELVTTEANAQGMGNYVDLILAIIQVESGGRGTRDIMQSSESAGYPRNYYQTEAESVRQGIIYLKSIVAILQGFNMGYENNARLIAQSYNFGSPFAKYVGNRGGTYDLSIAEDYSRTVVAPSLGNFTSETYSYVNQVSKSFGKTYLYRNGGNFFYGELVGQYLGRPANVEGDFAIVLAEVEKYNGWSYVWGGKSPQVGFDCSGLVAWGLKQVGIDLPSPAANQYNMTVPVSEAEARPGDLIFFKGTYGGPNHVSHVGFYVDANTMYDSNGSGVGYHNWKSPYWQKYKPEIRRIVQ